MTAEGELLAAEAEMVVIPAADGEIGILDRHVPLLAVLKPGPLRVVNGADEQVFFVSGGFVDVGRDEKDATVVTVLADSGEHAADIDEAQAEEARREAERHLEQRRGTEDFADAAAHLERSVARIRVAELGRRRRSTRERRPTQNQQ
ncbi:MAG: ATP synthase F1 subunit epsilon [Candidatus Dormibacteria bacterium]